MKKRLWSVILSLCLLLTMVPTVAFAADNTDDWTECTECSAEQPHMIRTVQDLDKIRTHTHTENGVTTITGYFKLANDIVFLDEDFAESGTFYNDGLGWIAIGLATSDVAPGAWSEKNFFTGTLDGSDFAIKNLKIEGQSSCGLFGNIGQDGILKNLTISNVTVNSNLTEESCSTIGRHMGVLAFNNAGAIQNCQIKNSKLKSGNGVAGAFVAQNTGLIDQCVVDNVKMDVFASSTVSANNLGDKAGLIAGIAAGGTISKCTVKNSELKAYSPFSRCVAGIAGYVKGNQNTITIKDCTVDACTITGAERVGGIGGGTHAGGNPYEVQITGCQVLNSNIQSDRIAGTLEADHESGTVTLKDNSVSNTVFTNSQNTLTVQGTITNTTVNTAKILGYDNQAVYVEKESDITILKENSLNDCAYAVVKGGTFADDTDFRSVTMAVPHKKEFAFGGWYDNAEFDGDAVTEAVAGNTYYAKWIEKNTPDIAITATPDTLTGGGSVELTVTGVPSEGTVAVTCDNGISVTATETAGKYTAQLPNTTKDYTFTATYAESANYTEKTVTCTVSVTRRSSGSSSGSTTTTNTVSASTASNGKVSLDKSSAKKGDTVTITVTPDTGYELGKLTVTDAKGNKIAITKKGDNQYTFTMPDGKVTVVPTFTKVAEENPSNTGYTDVADKDWFADAVSYVTNKGLMGGTGDNKFSPSASTTRGMLMTVLARYAGADTTGTPWYQAGMEWAKANGVSDGTNPIVNITREQLVTMLYRYAGSPSANGSLSDFSDASTVSSYAVSAMQWAVENGIVNGSNGKLNPKNNATRAEVAAILMRYCEMGK